MKNIEITKLLSEQKNSYLQHKDRNTYDETDLSNLKKGILKRKAIRPLRNTYIKMTPEEKVAAKGYQIEVVFKGETRLWPDRKSIINHYGINKYSVQTGMKQGHYKKKTYTFKKILINKK